jgi:cytochrome P450
MSFRRVANDELRSGSRFSSSSSSSSSDDMLGLMMRLEDENGVCMSGEEIHDNILTILYAAYDSSASVLCWIIKVLTERPNLLASIKVIFSLVLCFIIQVPYMLCVVSFVVFELQSLQ